MDNEKFIVSGKRPSHNRSFQAFPYLEKIDFTSILTYDDETYIHKKLNPNKMQQKEKKQYLNKISQWKTMTIREIVEQKIFSPKPNNIFKYPHPSGYPYSNFEDGNEKETASARISLGYRVAGHLWKNQNGNLFFFAFWTDTSPHIIYDKKHD